MDLKIVKLTISPATPELRSEGAIAQLNLELHEQITVNNVLLQRGANGELRFEFPSAPVVHPTHPWVTKLGDGIQQEVEQLILALLSDVSPGGVR